MLKSSKAPFIIANWKAEGSLAGLMDYITTVRAAGVADTTQLAICPPAPLLLPLKQAIGDMSIAIGAQNCRSEREGGSSGNPYAALLAEIGCSYVLAGHADRRSLGDNDDVLRNKLAQIAAARLVPIFCISDGDELQSRQLMLLVGLGFKRIVIAYEPMWAIGSGRTPEVQEIGVQLQLIRQRADKLLPHTEVIAIYGGSVTPENAGKILTLPDCGGVLVGKAAYTATGLVAIAKSALNTI